MTAPAPVETIASFSTLIGSGIEVAGDSDTPGAESLVDSRVLWMGTGSRPGNPLLKWPARVVTDQAQGGATNKRALAVTGKSWANEFWTANSGQVKAGFERRIYLPDLSDGFATVPGDMTEGAIRYGLMRPGGEAVRGDQKLPDLSGADVSGGVDSAFAGFSQSGFVTYDGFTFGLMTSAWAADTTKYDLTVYISAYRVGGTSRRYPDPHYASSPATVPGGTTRLLLNKDAWYEIVIFGRLNSVGVANGIFELYVTPAGSTSRLLRHRMTDVQYRTRSATRVNMFKDRNFWGGPIPAEAPQSQTTQATAPHMRDFVIARAVAAIPMLRGG